MANNADLTIADAAVETPIAKAPPRNCPRCQGRLFSQGSEGDRACFTCGHIVYGLPPLESADVGRRTPSHGGWRLT